MTPPNDEAATGSTPSNGEGVDPTQGSGTSSKDGFAAFEGQYTGEQQAKEGGEQRSDGGANAGVAGELLQGLGAAPFDLAALKTGHGHWALAPEQKAMLGRAWQAVGRKYGVEVSEKTDPLVVLCLGYIGLALPRILEELRLIRKSLETK